MSQLLKSLCRANQGIMLQKLDLMKVLSSRYDIERAHQIYRTTCPVVKATMGQHMRHSLDHVERALNFCDLEIHYDLRERDTPEEKDWNQMEARIHKIQRQLAFVSDTVEAETVLNQQVQACFMLTGDSDKEFCIPSMAGRELAFAAHHGIHHMALIRIIATGEVGGLKDADLPIDFGRAPSTVNFERCQ